MFITWFIIFAVITGAILYCNRDDFYKFTDWLGAGVLCTFAIGFILLFAYVIGSEIATDSAQITTTTTTIGAIVDTDNAVIIINTDHDTNISIATYDVVGKLTTNNYDYDNCTFENSEKGIVEQHKYTFTNKMVALFFDYADPTDYTIKTTDSHIVDGTRIG